MSEEKNIRENAELEVFKAKLASWINIIRTVWPIRDELISRVAFDRDVWSGRLSLRVTVMSQGRFEDLGVRIRPNHRRSDLSLWDVESFDGDCLASGVDSLATAVESARSYFNLNL